MWIQISSGKGPVECELAVSLFLHRFLKECHDQEIAIKLVSAIPGVNGNNNTYQSVLLSFPEGLMDNDLKSINGTVLWTCKSPLRPDHKRKNWFIDVTVFEEPESLEFHERNVKFEAMKSSGPGGQNVNKVETAVRAIHLPTGLVAVASEERTQYLNKKLALARLANQITLQNQKNTLKLKNSMRDQHNLLVRGKPIRVYEGKEFKLKKNPGPNPAEVCKR
jgi:peptide chain release factor